MPYDQGHNGSEIGAGEDNSATGDLTINAAGADSSIIDGNQLDRVLHVHSGATVVLDGLKITNGKTPDGSGGASEDGGGVYNAGSLTIRNSTLSGNSTGAGGDGGDGSDGGDGGSGGGLYNVGTLTLNNSTVSGNTTGIGGSALGSGGGIYSSVSFFQWSQPYTLNISSTTSSSFLPFPLSCAFAIARAESLDAVSERTSSAFALVHNGVNPSPVYTLARDRQIPAPGG